MTQADAHYVDCDYLSDTIASWTDARGQVRDRWYPSDHTHLEGEEVQVLGDGAYLGTDTVASGAITLDDDTTTNHVGLAFTSTLKPSKLDIESLGIAIIKKVVTAIISFYNTLGGKYGDTDTDMYDVIFRDRDDTFGSAPAIATGIKELPFDTNYEREGNIIIEQEDPLPMTVRGIILPTGVYDDG
jgi:hypothetical protein